MWKYLKTAFADRWNLLALFAASGLALLSGAAGFWLPLVAAGELLYLGLLGSHPKYQKYVDAQDAHSTQAAAAGSAQINLKRILGDLPEPQLRRFVSLRNSCLELRKIATSLQNSTASGDANVELQTGGFDRLLWIYLRLLYTQNSLEQFLERTSSEQIESDIRDLEQQLTKLGAGPLDDQRLRGKAALDDNLQTCRERLANFQQARGNHELVLLEIDRLENKIRTLSELAVNRQDAGFITGQVDQVAADMKATETTMNDLRFATGFGANEEAVPPLMRTSVVKQAE